MKKRMIILSMLISLFTFITFEAIAQEWDRNEEVIEYSVEVDRNAYERMVKEMDERGISGREFGEWVSNNSYLRKRPGRAKFSDRLTVMVFDENGRVVNRTHNRISGERLRSESDFLSGENITPKEHFFTGDQFFPSGRFIESQKELEEILVKSSRRVLMESDFREENGFLIFFIVTPDSEEFEQRVKPGGAVFLSSGVRIHGY
jgi:hypothetical protein